MADLFEITDDIREIGESAISSLINQLGKVCLVVFDSEAREQCPNCFFDTDHQRSSGQYNGTGARTFTFGTKCPVCKGTGYNPGTETTTAEVKLLVDWQPKIPKDIIANIQTPKALVLAKGFIADMPTVVQAKFVIIDHARAIYGNNRFILFGEPVVQGNIIQGKFFNCWLSRSGG